MIRTITIVKQDAEKISELLKNGINTDLAFEIIQKDTVGKSSSNPIWGFVYPVINGEIQEDRIGLYKEYDYDCPQAAYSEKIASIMGKKLLSSIRVPDVDIVELKKDYPGIISYQLLNNSKEDMFHIRDLMFHKFTRDELDKQRDVFELDDIIECIGLQVKDKENYELIKRNIIKTLMFDAVTNNGDRHTNNWALVRNKETNFYELAIFDHASCFIDMIKEQKPCVCDGWTSSYTLVKEDRYSRLRDGNIGKDIIQYICRNYRKEYDEFTNEFNEFLSQILEEIQEEKLPIDIRRLEQKLRERKHFLNKVRDREDGIEYE